MGDGGLPLLSGATGFPPNSNGEQDQRVLLGQRLSWIWKLHLTSFVRSMVAQRLSALMRACTPATTKVMT